MITELIDAREIRSELSPTCMLCGSVGADCYSNQRDRLFRASGSWSFKKCPNDECGLLWLDPKPLKEDIVKAYAEYYTHAAPVGGDKVRIARSLYRKLKRQYILSKYNYQNGGNKGASYIGNLLYLLPLRRREVDAEVRFLNAVPQGRLLDVGCGSGDWLNFMRDLGWDVEGIDFDENAVTSAKRRGLRVGHGSLEEQKFDSDNFDAITLNHVIEHVPDPAQTLRECLRLLKRGGKIVVSTPNAASLGHDVFGQDWRGLEPPRHLHVFSMKSLRQILVNTGFEAIQLRPQIASSVIYESLLLRRGGSEHIPTTRRDPAARLVAWTFNIAELFMTKFNPSLADCVTAVATKA